MKMDFEIIKENDVSCKITSIKEENEILEYEIELIYANECIPTPVIIKWKDDMVELCSYWSATIARDRTLRQIWAAASEVDSKFYFNAPTFAVLGFSGENKTLVALSDVIKPHKMKFGILFSEVEYKVGYELMLLNNHTEPLKEYKTILRIDKRNIPFVQAMEELKDWWTEELSLNYSIPEAAELPVYSAWYSFLLNPRQDVLLKELSIASDIGLKTVIIDDGWFFSQKGIDSSYSKCGDWEVSKDKFYDFKAFVESAHALDLKVMLWFSVPFMGIEANTYKRFSDKFLYHALDETVGILDVRYKEVRDYLVDTYVSFSKKYDLDGLKLDFMDWFRIAPETPPYNEKMDYVSLEQAVCVLLEEINFKLKEFKEDFLIEFRQYYVGPEILRYCNMVRAMDCAYDSILNRVSVIDLQLIRKDVAVHSDMLYWSPEEKLENCGVQLLNVMFSVPQISVRLVESTPEQIKLIKNFLSYWNEHRDIILHGKLDFKNPEIGYTEVSSVKEHKKITVLYAKNSYCYTQGEEDIFNATNNAWIYLENATNGNIQVEIYDCLGVLQESKNCNLPLIKLNVPIAGHCKIVAAKC